MSELGSIDADSMCVLTIGIEKDGRGGDDVDHQEFDLKWAVPQLKEIIIVPSVLEVAKLGEYNG